MKIITLFFCLLAAIQLQAQPNLDFKNALRDHYIQNIYQVLKPLHQNLEQKWTTTEAEFLATKRAEFCNWKQNKRELQRQIYSKKQSGATAQNLKEAFGQNRQKLKKERQILFESMQPFVQTHQAKLKPINEKLQHFRQQWQKERQAIYQKFKNKERRQLQDDKTRELNQTIRFLLWNGKNPYSRK